MTWMISRGPTAAPSRQPVMAYFFEKVYSTTDRSRIHIYHKTKRRIRSRRQINTAAQYRARDRIIRIAAGKVKIQTVHTRYCAALV